jgi:hypothetical protein
MNVSKLNRNRVMLSASRWTVPREYFDALYNYLVYGFEPGSFWTAVLANDFMSAIQHSHPANTIEALKHATGWIQETFPQGSYGDRRSVAYWAKMDPAERRLTLEHHRILLSEQEEIMAILKGEDAQTFEPVLW